MTVSRKYHQFERTLASGFQDNGPRVLFLWALRAVWFFFPFGVLFVGAGVLPREFSWTASIIIILSALATFLSELRFQRMGPAAADLLLIAGVLFIVEWVGVTTGIPFGTYRYTDALGLRIAGVPVAISFAWYATVVNAVRISQHVCDGSGVAAPLSAALITVSLDLALEPMASFVQQYWIWEEGAVPLMNYVSWFVLSYLAGLRVARSGGASGELRKTLFLVGLLLTTLQFFLFVFTDLLHGYVLPVATALGLIAIVVITWNIRDGIMVGRRSVAR